MIRFFRVLRRVIGWLLRTRVLRPVLALALFVWVLDEVVETATDEAWFSSVGMGELWREQCAWAVGVGTIFIVAGLVASIPLMRAVAQPVASDSEEPSLPRALRRWQTLRARATRLGWLCIFGAAIFLGHGLSLHWSEFALATSANSAKGAGIADFWMLRAPALQSGLTAAWSFALVVGAVTLGAGALRALPFLAARPSMAPVGWLRALGAVGATLCLLRALGFVFEAMRHAQIANDSAAARVGFILFNALGALGCVAILTQLRRPRPMLLLGAVAVLLLPALGGDLLSPFVGRASLLSPVPEILDVPTQTPDDWPQWDEATLLRAARLHLPRDGNHHIVEWQRAGISARRGGSGNRADIVGTPVQTDEWVGHGLDDREGEIAWQSVELPEQRAAREERPLGPLFYGLSARPLLSADVRDVGVSFEGWPWKLAWAWHLRDPLLLIEGAKSRRLLVERGAREAGQKLAPFWTWDDVVPRRDPQTGNAYFECVAYCSSAHWPRSAAFESGIFAGQNRVTPVAVLRLDARSGAIRLAPFKSSEALTARWKTALPALFGSNASEIAPTPALEVALAGGTSLVWLHTSAGWEKKAIPIDYRVALGEKLDEFAGTASSNSQNHLDGATPLLWRQGGELFLAQAFFDLGLSNPERSDANVEALPLVTGIAAGPLQGRGAQWSTSFKGVRAALGSLKFSPSSNSSLASPFARATRPTRDIAQEALNADDAAYEALKAGRYVDSHKERARLKALLKELREQRG